MVQDLVGVPFGRHALNHVETKKKVHPEEKYGKTSGYNQLALLARGRLLPVVYYSPFQLGQHGCLHS